MRDIRKGRHIGGGDSPVPLSLSVWGKEIEEWIRTRIWKIEMHEIGLWGIEGLE